MVSQQPTSATRAVRSAPATRRRIGEILLERGWITETILEEALGEAKRSGDLVGNVLIRRGLLTRDQLGQALSIQHNVRYVNLGKITISAELLTLLPDEFMLEKRVVPVAKEGGRLVVAMVDPLDRPAIDEITFITGMRPQAVVTTHADFLEFTGRHLRDRGSAALMSELSEIAGKTGDQDLTTEMIRQQRQAEMADMSNPLVKLVNSLLEEAIQRNASDIHVEPRKGRYLVRFRVDGILRPILHIPDAMESSFITRIKVMSRMDIAEHRRPQDGRVSIRYNNMEYNLRVNTLPLNDDREKIVIRILRPAKSIAQFDDLGLSDADSMKLKRMVQAPYGIVLVCGPTGSGKTTTLYTILNQINQDVRNILTVEDPVELSIEGLNQSQVNAKADYTFSSSLRGMLRQDPDVIMVGEVRDLETLDAAIHAALTGHLVFSTVHSNTTASTITRLQQMGASSHMLGAALVGVVAQRLVRKICDYCKKPHRATPEEKSLLLGSEADRHPADLTLYKGKGCDMCEQSGYSGRIGLFEILTVDREIRALIHQGQPDLEIEDAAIAAGMHTLAISGKSRILSGHTTIDEVIRVLGPDFGG